MREKSFRVYVFRLLKATQPGLRITKPAMEAVDSIIRVIAEKLVDKSLFLTANDDKKTVSSNELQTAVHMVLPSALATLVIDSAQKSVVAFEASEEERKGHPVEKAQTRESRCGLTFSVSAAEKYVRRFGQVGYHVTATCPVFLASVLEAVSRQLLQSSGEITQLSKKITITVRHIFLAVKKDTALDSLLTQLGVVLLEGGVEPQSIQNKQHKRLHKKKESKDETKSENGEATADSTKPHRWRPGTKTVMQIRKLQKSGDMLMQHAPFNRLVREIVKNLVNNDEMTMRITGDFFTSLQSFVEDRVILLMTQANQVANHAGRETVYARDIQMVCSLLGQPQSEAKFESNIPEAALRQMALRAGIRRFGDCSTEAYRVFMVNTLVNYLRMVILCASYHKIQTLNTKLFLEAMAVVGVHPSIVPRKRKSAKKGSSSKSSSTDDANEEVVTEEPNDDETAKVETVEEGALSDIEEELSA